MRRRVPIDHYHGGGILTMGTPGGHPHLAGNREDVLSSLPHFLMPWSMSLTGNTRRENIWSIYLMYRRKSQDLSLPQQETLGAPLTAHNRFNLHHIKLV